MKNNDPCGCKENTFPIETKRLKVYVAGPYTKGDQAVNVKNAIDAANEVMQYGMYPYCPHLTHFQHIIHPRGYEDWMELDIEFLKICDAVLRIPGESSGADREVEIARLLDIPVFECTFDLVRWKNGKLPWKMYDINNEFIYTVIESELPKTKYEFDDSVFPISFLLPQYYKLKEEIVDYLNTKNTGYHPDRFLTNIPNWYYNKSKHPNLEYFHELQVRVLGKRGYRKLQMNNVDMF